MRAPPVSWSGGFKTFKVKVGSGEDEARVAAVRRAVGDGARIRVDANGALPPAEATEAAGRLEPLLIELVEQPCAGVREIAVVRSQTAIPIVADESVTSVDDARALLLARGCDAATIKLAKVGGPLEALRIAAILPSYLSSALDGPIGIAAALHTAQALPRGGYAESFAHGLATLGMFSSSLRGPARPARARADAATRRRSRHRGRRGGTPGAEALVRTSSDHAERGTGRS